MAHHNLPNLERARFFHGLRSSSAASPQEDRRTRRARTRSDARRKAIREGS